MKSLIEEQEREFEEKFAYENSNGEMIIRYALCNEPASLNRNLKSFLRQSNLAVIERVVEMCDEMRKLDSLGRTPIRGVWEGYYNQALSDLRATLLDLLK